MQLSQHMMCGEFNLLNPLPKTILCLYITKVVSEETLILGWFQIIKKKKARIHLVSMGDTLLYVILIERVRNMGK